MDEKPIKVAQVLGFVAEGGVESMVMSYYRNIDKAKVQFDFLVECTSKIINKEEIEKMGGKIIIIPSMKNIFKYEKQLKSIFKENNYDIVHAQKSTLNIFPLYAAKKAGIKVRISHSHSTSNKIEWKRNIIKNILRPFSKLYATDYFACSELAGRYLFGNKTFDQGKVTIINNAIDINKFKFNEEFRSQIRKKYNIENKFVIGHIGRFVTQKNHSFLIDIFYEYQMINPNSCLLLIGDGPLFNEIKDKVNKLNINDKVIFVGSCFDTEKYYSAMDLFLLPSLYEGLPVVGVEAQINGINCLFSDTITKEIKVTDNANFLSLKNSSKEWALEINKTKEKDLNDRELNSDLFVNSKYDIKNEASNLLELYNTMMKRKQLEYKND